MRKKQFVILIIILAAAIAAVFGMRAANEKKEKAEAEKQKEETVYACQFESEDVTEFSYQYEGAPLKFRKTDDAWISENDEKLDLDEDQITTMLSTLSSITADRTFTSSTMNKSLEDLEKIEEEEDDTAAEE